MHLHLKKAMIVAVVLGLILLLYSSMTDAEREGGLLQPLQQNFLQFTSQPFVGFCEQYI